MLNRLRVVWVTQKSFTCSICGISIQIAGSRSPRRLRWRHRHTWKRQILTHVRLKEDLRKPHEVPPPKVSSTIPSIWSFIPHIHLSLFTPVSPSPPLAQAILKVLSTLGSWIWTLNFTSFRNIHKFGCVCVPVCSDVLCVICCSSYVVWAFRQGVALHAMHCQTMWGMSVIGELSLALPWRTVAQLSVAKWTIRPHKHSIFKSLTLKVCFLTVERNT